MSPAELEARRTALLVYLMSCAVAEDWHGVRDAAVDLEVIEARIAMTRDLATPARRL